MTQRERLAEQIRLTSTWPFRETGEEDRLRAAALLARGVRVMDAETLGAAMEKATKQPSGEIADFYVRFAADVLAALDGAE